MDFLEQIITSVIYFEGTASGTVSNSLNCGVDLWKKCQADHC